MARIAIKTLFDRVATQDRTIRILQQDIRLLKSQPKVDIPLPEASGYTLSLSACLEGLPPSRRLYKEAPVFIPCLQGLWTPCADWYEDLGFCAQAGVAPNAVQPRADEGTGFQTIPTRIPEAQDFRADSKDFQRVPEASSFSGGSCFPAALHRDLLGGETLRLPEILPGCELAVSGMGAEPGPKSPKGSGKADVDSSEPNWETLPTARSLSLPLPFYRKPVVNEPSMQSRPNPSAIDYSRFDHIVLSEDENEGDYESISDEEVFAYQDVPEEFVPAPEEALSTATAEEPEQEMSFSWDEVELLLARQRYADMVTVLSACPAFVPKLRGIIPALEGMSRDCAGTDLKSSLQLRVKAQILAAVCDGDRAEVATLTRQLQRI